MLFKGLRPKLKINKSLVCFVLIIVSVFACGFGLNFIQKNVIYKTEYNEYVDKYSDEYNVDKALIYSVIKCESSYDESAVSSVGAIGLMQITPETFDWMLSKTGEKYTHDDLYKPEINIKYGTYLLSLHTEEFADLKTALCAYHAGRGIVNEWLNNNNYSTDGLTLTNIPYKATASYAQRVIKTVDKYKNIYGF